MQSILEYNYNVLYFTASIHIKTIEAIQNRFFHFISFKYGIFHRPHSQYEPLLNQFNMKSLDVWKTIIELQFLYKILNNYLNAMNCLVVSIECTESLN
jgi:hypothetical protein